MAHVEHYKSADMKRLSNEWERNDSYECRDGRIDPKRTQNNYMLENSDTGFLERANHRIDEVPHSKRKDLNVISDWVVTCPQELLSDPKSVQKFFALTYSFVQARYGSENVLQGFVHMDEKTPHVHIPFVPVKNGRISSKALFTRTELSRFHKDLDRMCEQEFGMKGLVLNGRTKGNYTVKELKERDRERSEADKRNEINKHNKEFLDKRKAELDAREEALKASERHLEAQRSDFKAEKAEFNLEAEKRLKSLSEASERLSEREDALQRHERELGQRENNLQSMELNLNSVVSERVDKVLQRRQQADAVTERSMHRPMPKQLQDGFSL